MTPERQPGKKWTVFIGVIATFTLLMLLVASVWSGNHRAEEQRTRAEIQKRLDAIRAAGEPVTAHDLAILFPDPPPEHDAKRLLTPALAALSIPPSAEKLPFLRNKNALSRRKSLDEEIKTNIEILLKINRSAADAVPWEEITNAWVGSGFAGGFTNLTIFPVDPLSRLATIMRLSAVYEAELAHGTNAVRELSRSLALVHTLPFDTALHYMIRRAGEERACIALERIVNQTELVTNDLLSLECVLANNHPEGFREFLVSFRCSEIWVMETYRDVSREYSADEHGSSLKEKIRGIILPMSDKIYKDSDYLELLDVTIGQIAALDLPPRKRFDEFQRLKDKVTANHRNRTTVASITPQYVLIDENLSDIEILTKLQVTRLALIIERWRLDHGGQLPEMLSELVPSYFAAVPLDPFDQQPLRYKKLAKGFVVYSVGPDFTDEGGKETPESASGFTGYDITFRVER